VSGRFRMAWRGLVLAAAGSVCGLAQGAATVTVEEAVEHQVVDGFGGFGAKRPPWSNPPIWDEAFVNLLVQDLGATIIRLEVPTSFEYLNDNGRKTEQGVWDGDPGTLNLAGFNLDKRLEGHHLPLSSQLPYAMALKREAERRKEPLKVVATIWSPPAWMKYNRSISGTDPLWNRLSRGGQGLPDCLPELAEYCEAYARILKRDADVDLYALSLQNEPNFAQTYESCVYSPGELAAAVKTVGRRARANGLRFRIFGPEDVGYLPRLRNYVRALCEDPEACAVFGIFAVHGYAGEGVRADEAGPRQWAETFELARRCNRPLWMTEAPGYAENWDGVFKLALSLHAALKFGKVSAWLWGPLSGEKPSEFCLLTDGQPTGRYYAARNYFRFVRPGAVQIESRCDAPEVLVTAFKHPGNQTLTLVLINRGKAAKEVLVQGTNLPARFQVYQTTSAKNCTLEGAVAAAAPVTLPASSVTTLFGPECGMTAAEAEPVIAAQPRSAAANEGEAAEFSVTVRGRFPFPGTFQWKKDGQALPGATLPVYVRTNVAPEDHGAVFTVEVANAKGAVTSAPAKLEVRPFNGAVIARAAAPPATDGQGEQGWESAKAYEIGRVIVGKVESKNDLSGAFRALWDDQNLYLRCDVNDGGRGAAAPSHESDGVELYLDGDNNKSGVYDDDDFQFVCTRGHSKGQEVRQRKPRRVATVTGEWPGGYRMDITVPWATVGLSPKAGSYLGFEVQVLNGGPSGKAKLAWSATTDHVWENPSLMGTAKLSR